MMPDTLKFYTLARLLAGIPSSSCETVDVSQMDGLQDVAQAIIKADDRLKAFEDAIANRPDADQLRQSIMAIDPASPPPPKEETLGSLLEEIKTMPDLPRVAQLPGTLEQESRSSGTWLNTYVDYASQRAPMLPTPFHESAGLWLLSLAIARRLKAPMPHDDIYPNLFILWVAPTTIYAKSTGLKISREIAEEAIPHLLLSNEFSPEGLLDDMAGKPPQNLAELPDKQREAWTHSQRFCSRRGLVLDEASSLFAGLKRDYNTGLAEALMRFYDCGNHRGRTRGRGLAVVKDSYMSFIGATTDTSLRMADVNQLWLSGLWPRFGLIIPTARPQYRRFLSTPERPKSLVDHLSKLAGEYLPVPDTLDDFPGARAVALGTGVFDAWRHYDEAIFSILLSDSPPAECLFGIYGRLPTQALKISVCIAVADWDGSNNAPTVEMPHWARAQAISESWREGAHRLYCSLTGLTEEDSLEQRILNRVAKAGDKGTTLRAIYRSEARKREEVEPVVYRLVREGLLEEFRPAGKKTDHYRIEIH